MALPTVRVSLTINMRAVTLQTIKILAMLLMTILAIENTVIALINLQLFSLLRMATDTGRINPRRQVKVDLQRRMRLVTTETIADCKMSICSGFVTQGACRDHVCPARRMLAVAIDAADCITVSGTSLLNHTDGFYMTLLAVFGCQRWRFNRKGKRRRNAKP
jgi:hypothetical protein